MSPFLTKSMAHFLAGILDSNLSSTVAVTITCSNIPTLLLPSLASLASRIFRSVTIYGRDDKKTANLSDVKIFRVISQKLAQPKH